MLDATFIPITDEIAIAGSRARLATWARRRAVPLALVGVTLATAMAYALLWGPLVRHHSYWITPGDIWGTFRTAQLVGWGDIGDIYKSGTGLVAFPGISIVLAPAALLVSHFGLSVSFPYGVAHATAWLVLGPYEAVLGALVLIPLDSLAELLGASRRARFAASVVGAIALWPVVAIWGHPEDPAAMAFAIWGLICILKGRWHPAGWLFGLAVVMQPLVVLMFPVIFAYAPVRRWFMLALRSVVPAAALLAIPLTQSWAATTTALFEQPNYPAIDHPTPWLALAPVLSKSHLVAFQTFGQRTVDGSASFTTAIARTVAGETVAAGPGRMIAIALAFALGFSVYRRRPSAQQLVWLCCVALSLRCVFEAVMNPYYLWPPLAIAFVLAARDWRRLAVAATAGGWLTWWSYRHIGPWEWWAPVVLLLGVVVVVAAPLRASARAADPPASRVGALGEPDTRTGLEMRV